MIGLGETQLKGRGVFARREFSAGELIEAAPVLIIPDSQWASIEPTILYHYTFCWGDKSQHAALAMGLGSFYNHSYTPNAEYVKRLDDETIDFIALKAIRSGEEITVNYNGEGDLSPVWFEVLA